MRTIAVRNVNEAYAIGRALIMSFGVEEQTRNGPVLTFTEPVSMEYERPYERILFDRKRGANPFFHLFEAFWMLAGRNDGTWLDRYVRDFSARYAEPDGRIHGAYGHRWRNYFTVDQLTLAATLLSEDSSTRQVVIQMWDADNDLGAMVKDKPCNTHIYFRVVNGALQMTVCNRSNDMVWGAYGANAVHMSILQELMARTLGLRIGTYFQVSNNLHLYKDHIDKYPSSHYDPYSINLVRPYPLMRGNGLNALGSYLDDAEAWCESRPNHSFNDPFFLAVLQPMQHAWDTWKHDKNKAKAIQLCDNIMADDWRLAAQQWLGDRP